MQRKHEMPKRARNIRLYPFSKLAEAQPVSRSREGFRKRAALGNDGTHDRGYYLTFNANRETGSENDRSGQSRAWKRLRLEPNKTGPLLRRILGIEVSPVPRLAWGGCGTHSNS